MKATVVIGANFGDEGKGLVTDYLAAFDPLNSLVIRFNGGAQAGHTVQLPDGQRHVFSHFSSGTLVGAPSYLSRFFIANPILFNQELKKLRVSGYSPYVTIHPDAVVTTPYDMYINQLFENFQGQKRHGSCGVGINETIERNLHPKFQLSVKDLHDQKLVVQQLVGIRDEWLDLRVGQLMQRALTSDEKELIAADEIVDFFLQDIQYFITDCHIADDHYVKNWGMLIFEGAQGLLLDQGSPYFPHVTRSNTGLQNVFKIASFSHINHLDVYYVTRCYLTRHGAGPLPNESTSCPCPYFKDDTNLLHQFQGVLRFAPLDVAGLQQRITADLNRLPPQISHTVTLATTCLDQMGEKIAVAQQNGTIIELEQQAFLNHFFDNTRFDNYLLSYGPTREHCGIVCR